MREGVKKCPRGWIKVRLLPSTNSVVILHPKLT
jgi:hypothetical protein